MDKLPELPKEEPEDEGDDEMVFEDNEVEMELPPPIQTKGRRKPEEVFVMPEPQPTMVQQAEVTPQPPPQKPKRQASKKQIEHLERIRAKSMETRVTRSQAKKLEEAKKTLNVPTQPQPQPPPYIQAPQPQFIMMPNQQQQAGLNRDDIESIVRNTMTNTLNDFKTKRDQELEIKRAKDEADRKESREREITNNLLKPSYARNKRYY
jgi:hypothetical protein